MNNDSFQLPPIAKRENARHRKMVRRVMRPARVACPECGTLHPVRSGFGQACSGACRAAMYRGGYRNPHYLKDGP